MTADPSPIGDHLRAAGQAIAARAKAEDERLAKAKARGREAVVGDDATLDQVRREGVEQLRLERWSVVIPKRFATAAIDDMPEPIAGDLQDWADGPDGRNLLLFGPVGTGKTHAAIAACRPPFDRGKHVRFLPVVELLDQLRPGGPEGALDELSHVDLLVLDDLGTERATDWTGERLGALVNRRWLEELPTVVTTNLPPAAPGVVDTLEDAVGPRTYSRLVGGAVAIQLGGHDLRRARRAR